MLKNAPGARNSFLVANARLNEKVQLLLQSNRIVNPRISSYYLLLYINTAQAP
jgi:DNA-binding transcriptional MocR family regulator